MITTYSGYWWINYGGYCYDSYGIRIRPVKKLIGKICLAKINKRKNFEYSIEALDWLDSMCDVRVLAFNILKDFELHDTIPWDLEHTELRYIESLVSSEEFAVDVKCHSIKGGEIGNPEFAKMILSKGIDPERINKDDEFCSIGYSSKTGSWGGWREGNIGTLIESYAPEDQMYKSMRYIDSLDEAKESAIRFVNQDF